MTIADFQPFVYGFSLNLIEGFAKLEFKQPEAEQEIAMSLDKGTKEEITKKFQLHEKDTGSADVQIAILTERIAELTEHLKLSPKDHASRLALLKLVGQRRKLLDYLNSTDTKRYQSLITRLNLRK